MSSANEPPPETERDDVTQTHAFAVAAGRSIGPYRLLAAPGEGGMGQVWLAEQTVRIRRQLALKSSKRGWIPRR